LIHAGDRDHRVTVEMYLAVIKQVGVLIEILDLGPQALIFKSVRVLLFEIQPVL
jgi:hypothetical protein